LLNYHSCGLLSIQKMKSKIHYEENLFFLTLLMKGMKEGLKLPLDADYFQDKLLGDLRFVDATLDKIFSTLKANPSLIHRAEYLYQLVKAEGAFSELLVDVLEDGSEIRDALAPYRGEFLQRRESHESDIHEIRILLRMASQEEEREDVITSEELSLLTRPNVDPEEKG